MNIYFKIGPLLLVLHSLIDPVRCYNRTVNLQRYMNCDPYYKTASVYPHDIMVINWEGRPLRAHMNGIDSCRLHIRAEDPEQQSNYAYKICISIKYFHVNCDVTLNFYDGFGFKRQRKKTYTCRTPPSDVHEEWCSVFSDATIGLVTPPLKDLRQDIVIHVTSRVAYKYFEELTTKEMYSATKGNNPDSETHTYIIIAVIATCLVFCLLACLLFWQLKSKKDRFEDETHFSMSHVRGLPLQTRALPSIEQNSNRERIHPGVRRQVQNQSLSGDLFDNSEGNNQIRTWAQNFGIRPHSMSFGEQPLSAARYQRYSDFPAGMYDRLAASFYRQNNQRGNQGLPGVSGHRSSDQLQSLGGEHLYRNIHFPSGGIGTLESSSTDGLLQERRSNSIEVANFNPETSGATGHAAEAALPVSAGNQLPSEEDPLQYIDQVEVPTAVEATDVVLYENTGASVPLWKLKDETKPSAPTYENVRSGKRSRRRSGHRSKRRSHSQDKPPKYTDLFPDSMQRDKV